jgi:hypothetical protein
MPGIAIVPRSLTARCRRFAIAVAFLAALLPAVAAAQWPPPPQFKIDVTLYGWFPSTSGELRATSTAERLAS